MIGNQDVTMTVISPSGFGMMTVAMGSQKLVHSKLMAWSIT